MHVAQRGKGANGKVTRRRRRDGEQQPSEGGAGMLTLKAATTLSIADPHAPSPRTETDASNCSSSTLPAAFYCTDRTAFLHIARSLLPATASAR
ncbi:unnamed protein product [Toxocara canis]|uniref:Uncharacterized protein n=1 Tax=Toxocara canis TaxID=6265 RepID=A0A183VCE4_TOXCA|nr:unnamed protein product [Toxocara canis]